MPKFDEDWSPILKAMRAGDFFVTSGEVLFRNFALEGSGPKRTVTAELEWTFPLEFVEVVWGDGEKTDRQVISATEHARSARIVSAFRSTRRGRSGSASRRGIQPATARSRSRCTCPDK